MTFNYQIFRWNIISLNLNYEFIWWYIIIIIIQIISKSGSFKMIWIKNQISYDSRTWIDDIIDRYSVLDSIIW